MVKLILEDIENLNRPITTEAIIFVVLLRSKQTKNTYSDIFTEISTMPLRKRKLQYYLNYCRA